MSVRTRPPRADFALSTPEGELISARIRVEPRLLEDLLETLASLPFPVNPQLHHGPSWVEFPVYESRLADLRETLRRDGFSLADLSVTPMIQHVLGRPEPAALVS